MVGLSDYFPSWLVPQDPDAVRNYFVGAPDRRTPWEHWVVPLLSWSGLIGCFFIGIFSLVTLMERRWVRDEKLSFPLLNLPLALTADDWSAYGPRASRRSLFALGVGIAFLFNAINIAHSLAPAFPGIGFSRPLFPTPLDRPWSALRGMRMYFELETIGMGYFVPLDVLFSVWFFHFAGRAVAVFGVEQGYDIPRFPFGQEQSAGGYLMMGLILLWNLRDHLTRSLARSVGLLRPNSETGQERAAWTGLGLGTAGVLTFCSLAGFSLALAIPYFIVLGLFVITYARIRAETGMPFQYVVPEAMPKALVLNGFGYSRALEWGGRRGLVLFSCFAWLSRYHHTQEMAAYQMDSLKLGDEARVSRRLMLAGLALGLLMGLGAAYWAHLGAYYDQGSNLIASAGGYGEHRARMARQDYQVMAGALLHPPAQDIPALWATATGAIVTAALSLLRRYWIGCPFHPLGYLMANAPGDVSTTWFPMLISWIAKFSILRVGGLTLYRRAMPLFLGLTIGHLLIAGILWPMFSLSISRDAANAYHVLFGE